MANEIKWNSIRPIDGKDYEGFEELVCQLAAREKNSGQFYRVGKPDGGKECFWETENGDLIGWQAKYYLVSLSNSQWFDLDDSVRSTIDNHPNLTKYIISIPINMPDGAQGISMQKKWNERIAKWKMYANSKQMSVEFDFWGSHKLIKLLIKKENEGLLHFFFNHDEFLDNWFERKNSESLSALGARYTPNLNFELPIAQNFIGLSRDDAFSELINKKFDELLLSYDRIGLDNSVPALKSLFKQINEAFSNLKKFYLRLNLIGIENIPFNQMEIQLNDIIDLINRTIDKFYDVSKIVIAERNKDSKFKNSDRPYNKEISDLRKLSQELNEFSNFINGTVCKLAIRPYLLIIGKAGMGKSHLLADLVKKRNEKGQISILLLGENFSTNEMPWTQILSNQLRKNYDEEVFLGALNAKAESLQSRIIIIIDAINEGNGIKVWNKRLKSFIQSFEKYPWLGLIISIRNSYEELLAPKSMINSEIVSRVIHEGFAEVEYDASVHFFNHYNISLPSIPLLYPEFSNPLFLKLFCEGLRNKGYTHVKDGHDGLTAIFNSFIESLEEKLSQPDQLYYDLKTKPLQKTIAKILEIIVERNKSYILYEEANDIANEMFKDSVNKEPFLLKLISEGILNKDLYSDGKQNYFDGLHFSYQRFQDHLYTSMILEKHLDASDPTKSFQQLPLSEIIKDKNAFFYQQNIVEALSILIPERINVEFHSIIPKNIKDNENIVFAFLDSLIWRGSSTINQDSMNYINEIVFKKERWFHYFLDTMISMAIKPNCKFNSDKLHSYLMPFKLSERDAIWTIWLQDLYGEESGNNSVKRLIDWAWSENGKAHISDECIKLASITLAWFLTSSNRYLRDASTKALINILQDRIHILIEVLKMFENVNDMYVYERLFGVAYGCSVRTKNKNILVDLSEYVYGTIFNKKAVVAHLLLRDYARGIIEFTLNENLKPKVKVKKIRPPYKSSLPERFPTNEEVDKKFEPKGKNGDFGGVEWGASAIINSMTTEYGRGGGYGDFGRYIFQSGFRQWKVDPDGLSNLAITRIFELGYDPKVFSNFDSQQKSSARSAANKERIGKKYQWIVFYELLAKVSDNIEMKGEVRRNGVILNGYDGPWSPYLRDIDPTILIKGTKQKDLSELKEQPWWFKCDYQNWGIDNEKWVLDQQDFPDPSIFLKFQDNENKIWYNLDVSPEWRQPREIGVSKWGNPHKILWYHVRCWLLKKSELNRLKKIFENDSDISGFMPETPHSYAIFNKEYHWSNAYFDPIRVNKGVRQIEVLEDLTGKKIASPFYTTNQYVWEEEFDCSRDESLMIAKPSVLIRQNLKESKIEGAYENDNGEIVCMDPSVLKPGPSSLIIRSDHLESILKKMKLTLAWFIIGEKQIRGYSQNKKLPAIDHKIFGMYYLDDKMIPKGKLKSKIKKY